MIEIYNFYLIGVKNMAEFYVTLKMIELYNFH